MSATCSGKFGCGKTWGGERASHCTVCHQTFGGDTMGDQHKRLGKPCLTEDEMREKGWREVKGVWRGQPMPDDVLAKVVGS